MRTKYETPELSANTILEIANKYRLESPSLPKKFNSIMKINEGTIFKYSPHGPTKDGLERRNPLIVAIGDSVTAGHFEFIIPIEELVKDLKAPNGPVDVTDSRESYVEKFRYKLIDKFETTSVSIINSGIGGDNIIGINKRIDRDVLSHNPDLVIINASLNWPEECGDTLAYKKELLKAIKEIKEKTSAEIVLMTSNMELPGPFSNPLSELSERAEVIRKMAKAEEVCLVDSYAVWEEYKKGGFDIKDILSNGLNHPSTIGHEVFAILLMKLFNNL